MINRLKFNRRGFFRGLITASAVATTGTEIAKSLASKTIQKLPEITYRPIVTNQKITTIPYSNTCVFLNISKIQFTTATVSPSCTVTISKDTDFTVSPGKVVVGKLLE